MRQILVPLALLLLLPTTAFAYFNATYLTTTVHLANSSTAHVVETINLYISNSSMSTYIQDRGAVNQTLDSWQKVLGTSLLVEHVFNPTSSISNFTFLPGPIVFATDGGGNAQLTMSYYAHNVTTVNVIAPRKLEYTFNSNAFNFQHTASGQALLPNTKLEITVPKGSVVASAYPLPEFPMGNYTNATTLYWNESEPLNKFAFVYVITESLQQEVLTFFTRIYDQYNAQIYVAAAVIAILVVVYLYFKVVA